MVLVPSWSSTSVCTAVTSFSCLACVFPAEADKVAHCFHAPALRPQSPCHSLFSAMFFAFGGFLLMTLIFKVIPKHSTGVLYSLLKCEKAVLKAYGENTHVR